MLAMGCVDAAEPVMGSSGLPSELNGEGAACVLKPSLENAFPLLESRTSWRGSNNPHPSP